jgi:hypothetical protein
VVELVSVFVWVRQLLLVGSRLFGTFFAGIRGRLAADEISEGELLADRAAAG